MPSGKIVREQSGPPGVLFPPLIGSHIQILFVTIHLSMADPSSFTEHPCAQAQIGLSLGPSCGTRTYNLSLSLSFLFYKVQIINL